MRANLVLALVFVISGFILCTLSLVFLNVQIPQEPFSLWSELPYAGMFQYSGIVCLFGAIIYLLMETQVSITVNTRNLALISVVILANFASFFLGGYYGLTPIFFFISLVGTSVVSALAAVGMRTKDLLSLIATATLTAALDEYAHTSVGTLTYFDSAVPSPLTVSGWSLFMILLITVARVMTRIRSLIVQDRKILRIVPVIAMTLLIFAVTLFQGYIHVFDWVLVLVYVILIFASFYYTYAHSLKWNLFLMIVSLVFGFCMEYMGRFEGLWTFHFMEPVSLLILFSWPLRIWTVNALCLLFNVDFGSNDFKKGQLKQISNSCVNSEMKSSISLEKQLLSLQIEGKKYDLEYDPEDPFVTADLVVAYSTRLAEDFMPIILDPRGYGSKPFPPEFVAYRLIIDSTKQKLCILYEVYWRRQDCTWKELNKDHDHDYEQIQAHFDMIIGKIEMVVVSSVGSLEHGGHGVEVFSKIHRAEKRDIEYRTSPKGRFPWGGPNGQMNVTEIREIPIERLFFEKSRPEVLVLNCYHAFVGLKRKPRPEERVKLKPRLEKLDRKCLERWYYRHAKNRFGHDISKPFEEPYIFYYPPPEDWKSRLAYSLLWVLASIKRVLTA